ncbi:hypothetical protein [Flavobacterium sp. RSSB_23]|uniref:hypothetical protein n=1 Tax=Flavobacterium sp. RSSB_23 TaxID=3447668 RepID=UPI003F411118
MEDLNFKLLLDKVSTQIEGSEWLKNLSDEHHDSFTDFSIIEGIIIRGHILVEKSLVKSISEAIYRNDEFYPEKLSFSQKVTIARMLGISVFVKKEVNALNKLRNQIAHTLEFDEQYIDEIINGIKKKDLENKYPKNRIQSLKMAISFICFTISVESQYSQLGQAMKGIDYLKKLESK